MNVWNVRNYFVLHYCQPLQKAVALLLHLFLCVLYINCPINELIQKVIEFVLFILYLYYRSTSIFFIWNNFLFFYSIISHLRVFSASRKLSIKTFFKVSSSFIPVQYVAFNQIFEEKNLVYYLIFFSFQWNVFGKSSYYSSITYAENVSD